MAADSFDAGVELAETEAFARSAASRFYYAGYQAMTALLLYSGQTPPVVNGVPRESWDHERTPDMILANLHQVLPDREKRYQLRRMLAELYKTRIYADYSGEQYIGKDRLKQVRRETQYLLKTALFVLPI